MSITEELRKYATSCMSTAQECHTLAIADRIDEEHEALVSYWQEACHKDGYDEGCAENVEGWLADNADAMAEHGWYRALDAEGLPIRLGDEITVCDSPWVYKVNGIMFYDDRTSVSYIGHHGCGTVSACSVHLHHVPTVEDVLAEFAAKLIERDALTNGSAQTIAEYAAKLRLAGDADGQ